MDRGPFVVAHCHRRHAGRAAFRRRGRRGCWRASDFWGKSLLDGLVHLPLVLPPVVTGYLLLISFGARGRSADSSRAFRHRLLFPLDRRGAGLRRHGLSAPGARDPAVLRGDRPRGWRTPPPRSAPTRRACSSPSRCRWPCPASSPAWCCASPRRWASSAPPSPSSPTFPARRRPSRGDLHLHADTGRRRAAGAARPRRDRPLARRAGRLRMAGAARRHAISRRVNDAVRRRGNLWATFSLAARFEAAAASTALFGPRARARPSLVNMIAGLVTPRPRPHRARRRRAVRLRSGHQSCPRITAASAMCSRKAGCSRI